MRTDYMGKDVFIGIDVHKKSYSVYCIVDREKVKSWTMRASPTELITQLQDYFIGARLHTVYEAGFSGFALHRALVSAGIDSIVVNPGSVETASRDRVKTDKRDAKKLSEQLSNGRLTSIYIPTEEEELLRLSTRLRAMIVKNRARIASQIKSKLYQFGYDETLSDDKAATPKWVLSIQSATYYPTELKEVLYYLCEDWIRLTKDLKELNKKIAAQSKANKKLRTQEAIYKSAPGIGLISARELSRELGSLQQFSSNKHLYSYLGLTPSESSSGERRTQGSISRCGRPRLRHLLTEVAWRSVGKDPELAEHFAQLSYRRGKKRAIVAIARILIGRIRSCFTQGQFYQQQPLNNNESC
jgi:transposase